MRACDTTQHNTNTVMDQVLTVVEDKVTPNEGYDDIWGTAAWGKQLVATWTRWQAPIAVA